MLLHVRHLRKPDGAAASALCVTELLSLPLKHALHVPRPVASRARDVEIKSAVGFSVLQRVHVIMQQLDNIDR